MKGKAVFLIVLSVLVVCVYVLPFTYNLVIKIIYPVSHEQTIEKYSKENELDPYLVLALIKAESNFVSDARSNKGARGLMQITEGTAVWVAEKMGIKDFDVDTLNEPQTNIALGSWYLSYLLDRYNSDDTLALCAYNAGSRNVEKWLSDKEYSTDGITLEKIPFSETRHYVEKIRKYHKGYKKFYKDIFED